MARPTYDDLVHLDLSPLEQAVANWKDMADDLKELSTEASNGMKKHSEEANWAGVNADVTRKFVRATAVEFHDAYQEALSIYHVLDTAHFDLDTLQKQLASLRNEADEAGLSIVDNRDGTVTCGFRHIPGDTGAPRSEKDNKKKDGVEAQINHVLKMANETDGKVTTALKKSHGNSMHNFGHAKYRDMDAVRAVGEADAVSPYTKPDTIPLPGPVNDAVSFMSYRPWINAGTSTVYGAAGYAGLPGGDKSRLSKAPGYFVEGLPAYLAGKGADGVEKHGGGNGVHRAPSKVTMAGNVLKGSGKLGGKLLGWPVSVAATAVDYVNEPDSDPDEVEKHKKTVAPDQPKPVKFR